MSQASTPATGSKMGRFSLAAELAEALVAPSHVARGEDGRLVRLLLVPRAGSDVDAVQRVAAQSKGLSLPNVMRLTDVEPMDGRLALAFEFAEGVSLASLLAAAPSGVSRNVAV